MKFVRVFALLFALLAVVGGLEHIANLVVVDGYNEGQAFWLNLIQVAGAAAFGYGAYMLTKREDV